jgi:1,4-dihydroxy-2-naphthoate octaprenyltransferase
MARIESATFAELDRYPFVVVSWVDDAGYPVSVATSFRTDASRGVVHLRRPAGDAVAIPTDRDVNALGSHIRPKPGEGYDERRYLEVWGRVTASESGWLTLTPADAWGWDEAEVPFFEYSERSVPQSRRYLAALSAERGVPVRPRLDLGWLFLRTTRLPFLTATFVPILLGILIAVRHGAFDWLTALLTVVGGALVHLGINVSNDIFDTLSGADEANVNPTQYSGGSRVLLYDLMTLRELIALCASLFGGAIVIGLVLVWTTGSLELLVIGVAGVILGIGYTAPPLKLVHRGLGEIAVALGFGPIMLLGAYVVQTGRLAWEPAIASVPVAILVALILYVNEIPDRKGDASVGKLTLPARWDPATVRRVYLVAALAAFAAIVVGVAAGFLPPATLVALAAVPLALRVHEGIRQHYNSPYTLMAVMGRNVQLHLLVGVLMLAAYVVTLIIGAFAR